MNTLTLSDLGQVKTAASTYTSKTGIAADGVTKLGDGDWAFGGGGAEPVSAYGIGDLSGGIMDMLKKDIVGVPVWGIGAGLLAVTFLLPALKKGKKRR